MFSIRSRDLVLTAILAGSFYLALAQPMPVTFTAELSSNTLGTPVETDASGEVTAILIGNQLVLVGTFQNLSSPMRTRGGIPTGASLRRALPGENGDSVRIEAEQSALGNGPQG